MTIFTDGPRLEPAAIGIHEVPTSLGESLGATAAQAGADMPVVEISGMQELATARGERDDLAEQIERIRAGEDLAEVVARPRPVADVPIADAKARIRNEGLEGALHLGDVESVKAPALDIMIDRAKARREREQAIARGPSGIVPTALSVGTSFLVGALDPLNVASAFIPVVGEARYGKMLADAGASALARARVRAGVGALEGAAGAAAIEPIAWLAKTDEGQDYTFAESLRSVMFGAGLGAGLRTGAGAVADLVRARRGDPLYPFGPGEAFGPVRTPDGSTIGTNVPAAALREEGISGVELADMLRARLGLTSPAEMIADLPPRAHEDLMRASIAALTSGESVRAGELIEAAAKADPRIAESVSFEAFHGSPHDFDRFDISKIGEGEGAQSYGNGLYFAENAETAKYYADNLSDARINGRPYNVEDPLHQAAAILDQQKGSRNAAIGVVGAAMQRDPADLLLPRILSILESGKELPKFGEQGNLYRVRIKAEPERFLDWDKPLGEQDAHIREALDNHPDPAVSGTAAKWGAYSMGDFYKRLASRIGDVETSRVLLEAGVPGIKYLDAGSRTAGDGTRNFVVFDDSLIEILDKNGKPIERQAPPAAARAPTVEQAIVDLQRRIIAGENRSQDTSALRAQLAQIRATGEVADWRALSARELPEDAPQSIAAAKAAEALPEPVSVAAPEPAKAPIAAPAEPVVPKEAAVHVGPEAARGPRARPEETWSLLEFLASRGGIKPDDPQISDLRGSIGSSNKFVPGFGHLVRKGGMSLDRAREAAVEADYLFDAGHVSDAQASSTVRTLLDAIDGELRGQRVYRQGQAAPERAQDPGELRHQMEGALDQSLEQVEISPASVAGPLRERVLEIMSKERIADPLEAYERAVMEESFRGAETGRAQRVADTIPGWDVPDDAGAAPRPGGAAGAVERPADAGAGSASPAAGGGNREAPAGADAGKLSPATKAALDAESQARELYQFAQESGIITEQEAAAFADQLRLVDEEGAARTEMLRLAAGCLVAAGYVGGA
ncbi:MAG: hypothetical protein IT481_08610 [Gammaproteobacteria bacterium]|nr:hypothetical protein [Gammaproteobacteria bacterium]